MVKVSKGINKMPLVKIYPKIQATHNMLCDLVNHSKTETEHRDNDNILKGFRIALDAVGINQLMDCDLYYIDQSYEGAMCCGIWQDWKPLNAKEQREA